MVQVDAGWHFRSDTGEKVAHCDAIFPIVRSDDGVPVIVGTGFYIAREGLFVTARHCFECDGEIASSKPFVIFHFAEGNTYLQRPIMRAWHSAHADVSVGIAAPMHHTATKEPLLNKMMTLTAERPPLGTQVVTYAFGKSRKEMDGTKTKLMFGPRFSDGILIDYFPNGRDRSMIPWPVYETSVVIHGGASGGPVVGENGTVFAINTSGIDGQPDVSYVTPIDFILDAEIENVVLPPNPAPRTVQLRDLARRGSVAFKPAFPQRNAG